MLFRSNTIEFFFLGKYYVVDFGYPMMKGYLAPYKEISYHLQEFQRRGGSPRTRHEKFNHSHLSFRCVIERTFGVWKNKWRIIRNMAYFPFHIQILIVSAAMVFHNFVRLNDRDDRGFIKANQDSISKREHNSEAGSSYEQNSGFVIERTFDVWKNKWRIIRNMPYFPFHIQILIVSATMVFHNFVRLNDRDGRGFIKVNQDSISKRKHNSEAGSSYEHNSGFVIERTFGVWKNK